MSKPGDRRHGFLGWQCRIRQMAIRQQEGRPGEGMKPAVSIGEREVGRVIVLILKHPDFGVNQELRHMVQSTNDPRSAREKGMRFLASSYYQRSREFQDLMTALFQPGSEIAGALLKSGHCRLDFEQYEQCYSIDCEVRKLAPGDYSYDATFWHNSLFNPALPENPVVIGFSPVW